MHRTATLVLPVLCLCLAAAVGLTGGCGQSPGCSLAASEITCTGETFEACTVEGCPISDLGCANPGHGCQIAPGMVLEHFEEKEPMPLYLCGDPLSTCGMWAEASCQVTVTLTSGATTTYAVHDSTCP